MFISVIHRISDPDRFVEMQRAAEIPDGLHVAQALLSADRSVAVCLWEAPSAAAVRDFLDPVTAGVCKNEYAELDAEKSLGLPAATMA